MDMFLDGEVTVVAANENGIDYVEFRDEETDVVFQVSTGSPEFDFTIRLTRMAKGFSELDAPEIVAYDLTQEQARTLGRVLMKCADDLRERELEQLKEARDAGAF
jgi:hypothetical protein